MTVYVLLLPRVLFHAGVRHHVHIIWHTRHNLRHRTTVGVEHANLLWLEAQLAFEECTVARVNRELAGLLLDVLDKASDDPLRLYAAYLVGNADVNFLHAVSSLVKCTNLGGSDGDFLLFSLHAANNFYCVRRELLIHTHVHRFLFTRLTVKVSRARSTFRCATERLVADADVV